MTSINNTSLTQSGWASWVLYRFAITFVALVLAACGGDNDDGPPDAGDTPGGDDETVNTAPQFISGTSASVEENQIDTGLIVMADDPEGDELTFSVSGGADQGAFTLNGGALSFQSAPDFEAPTDSNEDNDYEIELEVTDGNGGTATQMVTVSVTDTASIESVSVSAGDQPKELRLSWVVGDPAARYRIEVNPDGASGFELADVNGDGQVDESDTVSDQNARLDTQESQLLALNNVSPQAGEMNRQVDIPLDLTSTDFNNALYRVVALAENGSELASADDISLMDVTTEGLIGYFKASNTDRGDEFGVSVALSSDGTTMAVGARGEDSAATGVNGDQSDNSDNGNGSGAVYVFVRNEQGVWSQQAYVKASNTDRDDRFGWDVALASNGNTLVVGAPGEGSIATGVNGDQSDNSAFNAGAVYVFNRDELGNWSQEAYIKASNTDAADDFGREVALSNDGITLAVGAKNEASAATGINGDESDNSAASSGAAYVFVRSAQGIWFQQAYIKASNTDASDGFGGDVALSGNGDVLAVGAYFEASAAAGVNRSQSDNSLSQAGAAYIFTRNEQETWSQQAYIKASNPDTIDSFGKSVSLSFDGATLAVGAPFEASSATGINGNQSDNSAGFAGAAYIFTQDDQSIWSQQAYIKASNTAAGDRFGDTHIALSDDGNTLAVGATGEDSSATGINGDQNDNNTPNAGAAYVFTRNEDGTWAQRAYLKASNTTQTPTADPSLEANDGFGRSIALGVNGAFLAVGAYSEDSAATGIGGDQSDGSTDSAGAVYLY